MKNSGYLEQDLEEVPWIFKYIFTVLQASDFNIHQDENAFSKKNVKPFGQQQSQFTVFVDEPARKTKAVAKTTTALNTSTELSAAVATVPQPRVPLSQIPGSPDIVCLEESTGISSLLYFTFRSCTF